METNTQNAINNNLSTTENKLWLPPFSPKDQKKLKRLRKNTHLQWTGFAHKTLWDWLQLLGILAIPVVVALASIYFSAQQNQSSLQVSEKQNQSNLQITMEQQRATILGTYIANMQNLLLNNHLRESKPSDEVRILARALTLSTLSELDSNRKGLLIQFLYEANLINKKNVVIQLAGADLQGIYLTEDMKGIDLSGTDLSNAFPNSIDLSGADLSNTILDGAILSGINLTGANLNNARLYKTGMAGGADGGVLSTVLVGASLEGAFISDTDLTGVNLTRADLRGATLDRESLSFTIVIGIDLRGAKLIDTDLSQADLSNANLSGIDLTYINLEGANLMGANLKGAKVTNDQLALVKSLKGAIMPDGSKHP